MSTTPQAPDHVTVHPQGPAHILALLVGLVAYLLSYAGVVPVLRYLPLVERWTWSPPDGAVTMGYYGVLLNASVAFLGAWAVGRVPAVARRLGTPPAVRWLVRVVAVLAVAAFAFVVFVELHHWSVGS